MAAHKPARKKKSNVPPDGLIDGLQAVSPYFNGHLFAQTITIHGNQMPVAEASDEQLRERMLESRKAAARRDARLTFAVGMYVFGVIVSLWLTQAMLEKEAAVEQKLTVFLFLAAIVLSQTYLHTSGWVRKNRMIKRRHYLQHDSAAAELDRRTSKVPPQSPVWGWLEFRRRARVFFWD